MVFLTDSSRRPVRCLAVRLALSGIIGLGSPGDVIAQFSVSPVILPISHSSEASEATVLVRNNGDSPLQLRVFVADFDQRLDGSHETFPAGSHEHSCADRLEVVPDGVSVAAGLTQPVTVRLRPGSDPEATCWSLVFVEKPPPEGTGPRAGLRIGVKVYGLSETAAEGAKIVDASVTPGGGTEPGRRLEFRVRNPDRWPILARGSVQLRDFEGEVHGSMPVESFSVLPEHDRTVAVPLDSELPPGRYLAIPVLEYGREGLVGAQVAFRID